MNLQEYIGRVYTDSDSFPELGTVHRVVSIAETPRRTFVVKTLASRVPRSYSVGGIQYISVDNLGREVSEEELPLVLLEYAQL